jgi:PhnB protein
VFGSDWPLQDRSLASLKLLAVAGVRFGRKESPMAEISPYLMYEDGAAAMEFLSRAFGFREVVRSLAPDDGRVWHAEMELDGARLDLGQHQREYRNPEDLGGVTVSVHVYVDDVDSHYERAKAAGVTITREIDDRDYGDRRYHAVDLEGHSWMFATTVREPTPEWEATLVNN